MHILVIEDEPKLALAIQKGLNENGFVAEVAHSAEAGAFMLSQQTFDLLVSDVILPGQSGVELLKKLRAEGSQIPVLLLTALGQIDDKESAFEAGADDYLTKPFEFKELLWRLRALSRRVAGRPDQSVLRYADIEMNMDTKEVFRAGVLVSLTPREFALLEYFIRNPERVISKTEISEKVWDIHFDTGTNVVEVYVNFLRKKIEKNDLEKIIHTHFKNGYMLRLSDAN